MDDFYNYTYKDVADLLPKAKDNALNKAQAALLRHLNQGKIKPCPCCGQKVKIYKRKLNSDMARWLIWLVRTFKSTRAWVDVKDSPVRGGDYAKLVHWGMVVQKPNDKDSSKRTSGLWKPTKKGAAFIYKKIDVPSHVHLYNNEVVGWSEAPVTIEESLGKKFNYRELMRS